MSCLTEDLSVSADFVVGQSFAAGRMRSWLFGVSASPCHGSYHRCTTVCCRPGGTNCGTHMYLCCNGFIKCYLIILEINNLIVFHVPTAMCSPAPRGKCTPGWETLVHKTLFVSLSIRDTMSSQSPFCSIR